ncbi:MAG: SH3 domain-containing protein [Sulfuricella sp.]|nr:SH3 domain-containing protein [Sulfuricella sp.]
MRIFLFLSMLFWAVAALAQTALVTDAARVNMRSGKGENYRLITTLPPHTEVEVVEIEQDHAKIKTADGQTGWVPLMSLNIRPAEADAAARDLAALETAQHELATARADLAKLQRETVMDADRRTTDETRPLYLLFLLFGAFGGGMAIGSLLLEAYYRKRLHGLRI